MTESTGLGGERWRASLTRLAAIRQIGVDNVSDVRHLHASSFRISGGWRYSETEIEAFVRQVYSGEYADRLLSASCFGAWIDDHLSGTCSWAPSGEDDHTARIADVFVSPLFARAGLARLLVGHAEADAQAAGFSAFTLRTGHHAVETFEKLGYAVTSQGAYQLADDVPLAVAFMRKAAASTDVV